MRDKRLDDFELRIFAMTSSTETAWRARLFIEEAIDRGVLTLDELAELEIEHA